MNLYYTYIIIYYFFHITNYVYHMLYIYISGDLLKQGVIPYTTDVELLEEKVPAIAWEYIYIYTYIYFYRYIL